jgi:Asp-tRNA(Asn)/Glu-tRNA(Gln) amidotransferase A subunit family amidase
MGCGWEYVDAMQQRDMWKAHLLSVFDAHDVMLCPTTPVTAPLNRENAAVRKPPWGDWAGLGEVHRAMEPDGHADACCASIL